MAKGKNVKELIRAQLLSGPVSSGEIAKAAGISRQAAHYHLRSMLEDGEVERIGPGVGRGTSYVRRATESFEVPLEGLQEHEVWQERIAVLPEIADQGDTARRIHQYAFTEMLNNAIDHSDGSRAVVRVRPSGDGVEVSIEDDGVGVFRNIADKRDLDIDEVIGELSKGKLTTDPDRHSGEGIFFTSKAVASFSLESDGRNFIVEGGIDSPDWGLASSDIEEGTRVTWVVPTQPPNELHEVFNRFASGDDFGFGRTTTHVDLFGRSGSFVSRSEGRRIAARLDEFDEVILDFTGVEAVGQGFADELFRVWASNHPDVVLTPINMSQAVAYMVSRATSG